MEEEKKGNKEGSDCFHGLLISTHAFAWDSVYPKQSCEENIPQFPIEHHPAQPHNIPTPTPIWGPQAHNWQALWLVEYDSNM